MWPSPPRLTERLSTLARRSEARTALGTVTGLNRFASRDARPHLEITNVRSFAPAPARPQAKRAVANAGGSALRIHRGQHGTPGENPAEQAVIKHVLDLRAAGLSRE